MVRVFGIDFVHIGVATFQSFERGYIEWGGEFGVQRHAEDTQLK